MNGKPGVLAAECCPNRNLKIMQDAAFYNATCLRCGEHWYGPQGSVRRFTRREWDAYLSAPEPTDTDESVPALSILNGFAVYLRDIGADPSANSMRSVIATVERMVRAASSGRAMAVDSAATGKREALWFSPDKADELRAALAAFNGEQS